MGNQNVCEMIAISAWYLWWERCKLVHNETTQNTQQNFMGIRVLTTNFVTAYSPNISMKRGGWSCLPTGFVKLKVALLLTMTYLGV